MSWECCNHRGECQQGQGCPSGGMCYGQPHCKDTYCPGHPGARVARIKSSRPAPSAHITLHKTSLTQKPSARRAVIKRVGEWLLVMLLMIIWALVSAAVRDADEASTAGAHSARKSCTHWSKQA